ncbi:MAG: type II toxin-antitoxin system HicB family antitoxin [Actinomycetota bacterium]|nr:type II toxin-antitoxin system HicB family antitoxin [Actinomycetota bacterium]MDQ3577113.1 type II toxin-antitoxin system HicB family antitoxin [Actinomycetota bacterium]
MDLTPYLAQLREDLTTTASAGDENTQRAAAVLSAALEPAVRLAIMNALSDLADEVTAALPHHVVQVRLERRDVNVVVTDTSGSRTEDATPPPSGSEGGDVSRMTLRLFEEIKARAEQAASSQGVSLNTFVQQAVQGALQGKGKNWGGSNSEGGSRVRGWYEG